MEKKLIWVVALTFYVCSVFGKKTHRKGHWIIKQPVESVFSVMGNLDETTREQVLKFSENKGNVVETVTDASGQIVCQETVSTATIPVRSYILSPSVMGGTVIVTDGENVVYGMLNF